MVFKVLIVLNERVQLVLHGVTRHMLLTQLTRLQNALIVEHALALTVYVYVWMDSLDPHVKE